MADHMKQVIELGVKLDFANAEIERLQKIIANSLGRDGIPMREYDRRREAQDAEIERLRADVVTFLGLWAAQWGKNAGLPDGHLHPEHYDRLKECGARMDDFTRAALGSLNATAKKSE